MFWRKGDPPVQLTNFVARIAEEVVVDDGLKRCREFRIEVQLPQSRQEIMLPAGEFAQMNWPCERIGASAIVMAGSGMKDHARAAIQSISGAPVTTVYYAHTGWREIQGTHYFLTASGGIGPKGLDHRHAVRLPEDLASVSLPEVPAGADLKAAIRAVLDLPRVAAPSVMWPLLAGGFRAPIDDVDFAIHLTGPTGQGKSALAALVQQHFGPDLDARHLPASWSSTENALEALAFSAKDIVLVIDDFVPTGGPNDVGHLHVKADRIIRAQGNRSGRARLTAAGSLVAARPPRGLILSTGEDMPRGQSIGARMLTLEVEPGCVDFAALSGAQEAAISGLYAQAMSGWVHWIAGRLPGIREQFADLVRAGRADGSAERHRRASTIEAELIATVRLFLDFAVEADAIGLLESSEFEAQAIVAIMRSVNRQASQHVQSEPAARFVELLRSALGSGQAHVASMDDGVPDHPSIWGWRESQSGLGDSGSHSWKEFGARVGWTDGQSLFLDPESV
ncbi:MAG: DUF927 domain-containing protein, partial [Vicinamibacteria bacterium]